MKLNWISRSVVIVGTLAAASPEAVFASEALMEGPPHNGLSSEAFRRNALTTNPKALVILQSYALNESMFSVDPDEFGTGYIDTQLADPSAKAVMEETIRCALGKGTKVEHAGNTWQGELGLCQPKPGAGPDSPNWGQSGPNSACQQLVTACLMARTNSLHRAIPVSVRGQPAELFPLLDKVPAETIFRESLLNEDPSKGTPIKSFLGPDCPEGQECNWAPAFVGKCDGDKVRLEIQDPSACGSTPLRVCAGIHGCSAPGSGDNPPLGPEYDNSPSKWKYWKFLEEKPGACAGTELEFNCPTEFGGYYSVMTRPGQVGVENPVPNPQSPTVVQTAGAGNYPVTERENFTFREGAFYGNLFDPSELTWECEVKVQGQRICKTTNASGSVEEICDVRNGPLPCVVAPSVPYRNVYACYSLAQQQDPQDSEDSNASVAYLNDRICDTPDPDKPCFYHKPRPCHFLDPVLNEQHGAHCDWVNESGQFQNCKSFDDEPKVSYLPITTYLNGPCDLIGNAVLCGQVLRSMVSNTRGAIKVAPGPRGCGGCSFDGAGGGLLPASIAAFLAHLVQNRRRRRAR
jgi:hypothetical protein